MDQHAPFALPIGTVISGYEIVRVLGVGGFGITYEGFNPVTKRRAAIKEFFPRGIASRDNATQVVFSRQDSDVVTWALDRFRRSTTELCEFRHPNIVDVLNYVPANETGYMFMEQVEGETLEQWLHRKGDSLTFEELRELMEPVCDALEYVHSRKFIHRDIAPDNIMIRRDGRPMLIDFGAIKIIAQHTQTHAASGRTYGVAKQHYSPPEQLDEDAQLDPRADVYALGAVMYRAVAGHPPVDADKRKNDLILKGGDSYVSVAQHAKISMPQAAIAAIDRALSLRPADRQGSIGELRAGLAGSDATTQLAKPFDQPTVLQRPEPMPAPGFSGPGSGKPQPFGAPEPPAQPAAAYALAGSQAAATFGADAPRRSNSWIGIAAIGAVVLIIGGVFLASSGLLPFKSNQVAVTPQTQQTQPQTQQQTQPQVTPNATSASAQREIERGDQLHSQSRFDDAVAAYAEAIRLDPNSAEAYWKRGRSWAARSQTTTREQYAISIRDFQNALRLAGNDARQRTEILKARAEVYGRQIQYKEQIADLNEVIRAEPNVAANYKARGTAYWFADQYDLSIADHTKAIQLDPKNWVHYSDRGRTNKWKKDYIAAIADYSDAIRLNSTFGFLYAQRGEVHGLRNDYDRSIGDYGEAIRLDPNDLNYYRQRAAIYVKRADRGGSNRSGDLANARTDLDRVLAGSNPGATDYEQRGLVLEKLGRRSEAIADFRAALAKNSNLTESRNALQRLGG